MDIARQVRSLFGPITPPAKKEILLAGNDARAVSPLVDLGGRASRVAYGKAKQQMQDVLYRAKGKLGSINPKIGKLDRRHLRNSEYRHLPCRPETCPSPNRCLLLLEFGRAASATSLFLAFLGSTSPCRLRPCAERQGGSARCWPFFGVCGSARWLRVSLGRERSGFGRGRRGRSCLLEVATVS